MEATTAIDENKPAGVSLMGDGSTGQGLGVGVVGVGGVEGLGGFVDDAMVGSSTSGAASTGAGATTSTSSGATNSLGLDAHSSDVAVDSEEDAEINVREDEQGKQWTLPETKKLLEAVKKFGRYSYDKLNEELKSHQLRPNDGIAQTRNRLKVVFGKKSPFKQAYKHKLFRLPKGVPGKSLTREQKIELESKHAAEQQRKSALCSTFFFC